MNFAPFAGLLLLPVLAFAQEKPAEPPLRPGITAHRDLAYVAGGHERQKLDLYLPAKTDGPLPLIIWVHGGGWAAGSKEQCPPVRQGFTERGYAVASLGYRLSSHATFPAQIEDCKAAIRWLRAHASEYQLDPDRFGVWGSSAGGHLVALLGTSGGEKSLEVGANLEVSSQVQAVCDFYGPTDLVQFAATPGYEQHASASSPEGRLLGGAVAERKELAARANPITYVDKSDPPFLILHGDKDPTVPINQSQSLYAALTKAGVSAHLHTIRGAGHGSGFQGKNIDDLVSGFFDARLKQRSTEVEAVSTVSTESEASATRNLLVAPAGRTSGRRVIPWERILARDDKNKDGKLTREEFSGPAPLFQRLDVNKDGVLTKEEHEVIPTDPAAPAPILPPPAAVPAEPVSPSSENPAAPAEPKAR